MKILVGIVNYGTKNDPWLQQILPLYRALPWQTDIVVLTNTPKDLGDDVEVRVKTPPSNPRLFPYFLRELLAERHGRYDIYIGTEDDVAVEPHHIEAFRDVSAQLEANAVPGFLRFENLPHGGRAIHDIHAQFGWIPGSVRRLDSASGLVVAQYENLHSALYMLTNAQLEVALQSGRFLEMHDKTRDYGYLEAATTHLYTHCDLTKWIPISRLDDFLLHHRTDMYAGWIGVSEATVRRYIHALTALPDTPDTASLVPLKTKMPTNRFDKHHFEAVRTDIIGLVEQAESVLWVGSGEGQTEAQLVQSGRRVTCIPLDSVHAQALQQIPGLTVLSPNWETAQAEIQDQLFTAIVLPEILDRFPEPATALRTLHRHVAPLGAVYATFYNLECWQGVLNKLSLKENRVSFSEGVTYSTHQIHPTTARLVQEWCREAGLTCHITHQVPFMRRPVLLSLGLLRAKVAPTLTLVAHAR
jgi:2-polyprenyl-3-methyl-5-hydroxy-6-metoxy-1,4-benzoquinol methylase